MGAASALCFGMGMPVPRERCELEFAPLFYACNAGQAAWITKSIMPANKIHPTTTRHDRLSRILAHNLVRLRKAEGVKMYAAAEALGVSKSTWSQWESGKRFPGGTMLAAIADYLRVQPCALLKDPDMDCGIVHLFTKREP